tara:strand:- start:2878 stop:3321 length:444 start_codon:yes stop_codon:yes gene_type:complete
MAVIKPTLTLTSNASTATTDPGPLSVALSLSATDSLTVDSVKAATLTVSTTEATLFDGSAEGTAGTGGTVGGFIYLKNSSTTTTRLVHIGIVADDGSAADLVQAGDTARLFTLKVGEFAFFPFDYTMDITVDADGAGTLEYWLFNRA